MGLQTYPPTSGSVTVAHTGDRDGVGFHTPFTAADGAPMVPTSFYTFDLLSLAPDLVGAYPVIQVFLDDMLIGADVSVEENLISVHLSTELDPARLRLKAVS